MKRFISALLTISLLGGSFVFLHAACVTPLTLQAPGGYPYEVSYTTGPNDGCYIYYLDKSGNVSIAGNMTVLGTSSSAGTQSGTNEILSGFQAYAPTTVVGVSSNTTLSAAFSYLVISSSGGPVIIGGTLPSISTATATNGEFIILGSTASGGGNTVTITSSTASGCDLGAATRTIAYGKRLGLIFDSLTSMWTELFYGSN